MKKLILFFALAATVVANAQLPSASMPKSVKSKGVYTPVFVLDNDTIYRGPKGGLSKTYQHKSLTAKEKGFLETKGIKSTAKK